MANNYIRVVISKKLIFYHVLGWFALITYEVLALYFVAKVKVPVAYYASQYVLNATLFYVNVWYFTREKRPFFIIFFLVLIIGAYMGIDLYLNNILERVGFQINRPTKPLYTFFTASFWRCLYFIGFSAAYGFIVMLKRSKYRMSTMLTEQLQREKNEIILEKKLLITQNALLRAQINPHLFFSTLNFIYNSVHNISANAGEAVMLLADITRYSISRGDSDGLVLLSDELVNINDLIELNQIRFSDSLQIRFDIQGNFRSHKIIPLVLLTLVENIFKYGDLQDPLNPALIHIYTLNGRVHFSTRNKVLPHSNILRGEGTGVNNAKFRLEDAYQNDFTLTLNETDNIFYVDLAINEESLCPVVIS